METEEKKLEGHSVVRAFVGGLAAGMIVGIATAIGVGAANVINGRK